MWVVDPFSVTSKPVALNVAKYGILINMVSDSHYQASFKSKPHSKFWDQLGENLSILISKAKFGLFSKYTAIKTKYQSRLDAQLDMCLN